MREYTDATISLPVFRPLIGLDKQEITDMTIKIGTYATSILPYEDCRTVFTPKHPATKPRLTQDTVSGLLAYSLRQLSYGPLHSGYMKSRYGSNEI